MRRLRLYFFRGDRKRIGIWLCCILLCCIFPTFSGAAEVQVTAKLDPSKFAEDQASRFILTVSGARSAEPEMPAAEGLHFIYQGQSSQASWVNGKISSSVVYNFVVQAEKIGDFTIAPVKVTVDGDIYSSEPVQGTVVSRQRSSGQVGKSSSGSASAASGVRPDADEVKDVGFMRITPETERMYSGQVVPFTLKAYFRAGRRITLKSAPRLNGEDFLLQSLGEEPIQQQDRVNGAAYTTLTWKGTLSAVKEGRFPLTVEMDAEVLVRSRARLQGNPFGSSLLDDPFFADVLGNYSRRDIMISSPEKSITVLDLPTENRPDGFSGAIGTFSLAVAASPRDGKVGDPITMKMQLDGSGNFALVQAPTLTDEQGWKVYPASGTLKELGENKGEKTFEQALIPTEQGLTAIPPVRFSYFDPKVEEYVTLTSEPIPVELEAATGQPVAQKGAATTTTSHTRSQEKKSSASQAPQHFSTLKPDLGKLVPVIDPLYRKLWFQLLVAVGLLCLSLAFMLYLRQRKLARDPSILRRKELEVRLAKHYEGMSTALAAQDQESFCQHCRAAIQQRAGEVWGLAPEAVTLADLEQRLPEGAPLRAVFDRLEQSGYAGEQLAQTDLEEILQTTKKELDMLA